MDTSLKKVSIILPAYNAEQTMSASIESVLQQTYNLFELIIINDGSIDATESIVKKYTDARIKYIKNKKNVGLITTLNCGLKESTGEFIARIDADDIWIDENKLQKQIDFMSTHSDCVLIGTQAEFTKNIHIPYPQKDRAIRKMMLLKNPFIHSSILLRRNLLKNLTYDSNDYLVEDYSLWLKLGLHGTLANLPDTCVRYYVNPTGETQTKNVMQTKNSLLLVRQYKNMYPYYYLAICTWNIRLIIRKISTLLHLK